MHNRMLVCCKTDNYDFGHCTAVFEVANRKQATVTRKLLFSLLPSNCHSTVRAISWSKQHYLEWRLAISTQAQLPLGPVKWFARGDKLPERFEDLQVPPEVLQLFLEELQEALRQKSLSYWVGYRALRWQPIADSDRLLDARQVL